MRQTFKKGERLHSKKFIENLFSEGQSFYLYPFKIFYLNSESRQNYPAQILISVSKRSFRKATERNKVKRLVRETYRMNKEKLYNRREESKGQLLIGLIYTAKTIMTYAEIERKIILILQRLIEQDEQAAG